MDRSHRGRRVLGAFRAYGGDHGERSMGIDAAMSEPVEAEVIEQLPSAAYRLRLLEDEGMVMAHAAGVANRNFVRLRPGDRVRVELAPRDRTRGRIVELLA